MISGAQLGGWGRGMEGGGGGRPPLPFFKNKKKCLDFEKKCPDCVHP